jgi:hypothetical protein
MMRERRDGGRRKVFGVDGSETYSCGGADLRDMWNVANNGCGGQNVADRWLESASGTVFGVESANVADGG